MASFQKRGDSWRAIVRLKGVVDSKTFPRKSEAAAWASARESEINAGENGRIPDKTFGQLLEKYRDDVSGTKSESRWETIRINRIVNGSKRTDEPPDPIAGVKLSVLGAKHIAEWRDRRLKSVSEGSVLREWSLLSTICSKALKEWKWLREHPMKEVARPAPPDPRDRRISAEEIERILFCAGYSRDVPPCTMTARVGAVFLFAIETAMRAGEICALRWPDVNLERRFCSVVGTDVGSRKTKAAKRDVALSSEAIRLIKQMPKDPDNNKVFQISTTQSLDALFRKIKGNAEIEDMHFHDTRHEAITRLSKKMDVLALARMVGHRDIRQLMVYYNESATDIAERLD